MGVFDFVGDAWDTTKDVVGEGIKYNPITAPAYWGVQGVGAAGNAIGNAIGDNLGATNPNAPPPFDEKRFQYNNGTPEQLYAAQMAMGVQGRQGPQLQQFNVDTNQANANYAASLEARQHQLSGLQGLERSAQGYGPSAAQAQLAMGRDEAIRAAQAMAASSRGGPGAMALANRSAMMQGAQQTGLAGQQSAMLRAQEMQAAQAQAQQAAGALRGQDISTRGQSFDQAMGQAQFGSNQAMARAQLEANQRDRNDAMARYYEGQKVDIGRMNLGAGAGLEQAKSDRAMDMERMRMGGVEASKGRVGDWSDRLFKSAGSVASIGAVASDRRVKRDISGVSDDELRAMLEALRGYEYRYKPGYGDSAEHIGVMAQDLERSPVGARLVEDTPHGKTIDVEHGFGAALAALAALNRRIEALEGKGRK